MKAMLFQCLSNIIVVVPLTTSSADPHKMARFGLVFLIGVAAVAADLCPEPVSFNFVIFLFLAEKRAGLTQFLIFA